MNHRRLTCDEEIVVQRVRRTGHLVVDRPTGPALQLFTPEGERAWVDGWHPVYAGVVDDTAPGTVFTTTVGDRTTTWIVVDRRTDGHRYARVTTGHTAGTVTVTGTAVDAERTRIDITYELSALSPEGAAALDAFVAQYTRMLSAWESTLAAMTG